MSGFRSVNKLPARILPTCDYPPVEEWITLNHLFHFEWEHDKGLGQQEFKVTAID